MTRFTDRVTRDLHQIADRSTPSSTAWDSIRTRIEDQADQPTVEVIMLSPDRNDSPKRGWMLAAAAVAVLALVGGLVFATTRSDDDNVPADTPEVTVTGTFTNGQTVQIPPSGAMLDSSGETTYEGEFAGVAAWTTTAWTSADGVTRGLGDVEFTGSIEGLGSGTLWFADRWQVVDGVWSSTATITGGTESFEGATGTGVFTPDPATANDGSTGTYAWDITVPPTDSLVTVTAKGISFVTDLAFEPTDVEGQQSYSAGTILERDMSGLAPHTGMLWVLDNAAVGSGDFEFTGEIAGLGEGTMTYTDAWAVVDDTMTSTDFRAVMDGAKISTVFITGGTGDFEGITGTGVFIDEGTVDSYEFVLTAPVGR